MTRNILLLSIACLLCTGSVVPGEEQYNPKPRPPGPTRAVAFLGIFPAPLPPVLRPHLDLPDGVGVLVDRVQPDTPAAKASLQRFDVLHKLNDQILINPQQLVVLVRMHKPGAEVKLTLLRNGKPRSLTVNLGARELPLDPPLPHPGMQPPSAWVVPYVQGDFSKFHRLPKGFREELRRHLPPQPAPQLPHGWSLKPPPKPNAEAKPPPKKAPPRPRKRPVPAKPPPPVHTTITIKTSHYTVTIRDDDGRRTATITDSGGKVLHKDLPEAKWGGLPADMRRLLDSVKLHRPKTSRPTMTL